MWSVYALCDLTPEMFPKTSWFGPDLTLVLHDYGTTILFAMGTASVGEALDVVTWPVHLQVRDDALSEVARHATVAESSAMWRMGWRDRDAGAADPRPLTRLGRANLGELRRLYADGDAAGDGPGFFMESALDDGVFYGAYEDGALIAVAGTHVVARSEGAATIGNVYTRRDRRGRGWGRAATDAVLRELADVAVVGLNVRADNTTAIRVYESLGFVRHCLFQEALAIA
ncbi:MAG: GNAT family N-acetyltransferase [Vicinamibacterales bacterium]